jgi:hypothetical protein
LAVTKPQAWPVFQSLNAWLEAKACSDIMANGSKTLLVGVREPELA